MLSSNVLLFSCIVAALVAAGLMVQGIRALLRVSAANALAVLPAQSHQTVSLAEAGPVVLAVSGSQFRTGFGGATFALKDAATGREVASETVVVRTKRSSLNGTVTLSVRRFTVPHAGDFVLEARGLSPGIEDSGARFILQRSHQVALAIHILRVVGSAVLLLAAIVVAVLSATGKIGHQ